MCSLPSTGCLQILSESIWREDEVDPQAAIIACVMVQLLHLRSTHNTYQ
jgi:hypothetical protein